MFDQFYCNRGHIIDNLQQVETEKLRKYDLLANELCLIHGKALEISDRIKAYIQSVTLKKTLENVSMDGEKRNENLLQSELV
ncbi:hypothetical protein NAPIS_ORF00847 [Vairimorpha apis BRL 01]|uniref:Uncharacterized protein n=1 Tax=Vairimorpha apis BRL 01 TaxID=1037528 RepID=T0LBA8_9MICR|nr:hypothetical protein NAPIS_ORF00847 [Vairimorpha apis BRL 01]